MKELKKVCCICGMGDLPSDPVVKTYVFGKMSFDVCSKCVSQKICPQCRGRGEILVKKAGQPATVQVCDLCFGSGFVEYSASTTFDLETQKMVKVPAWVYENLRQLKLQIERKPTTITTEIASPKFCPKCGEPMESIKMKYEYVKCPKCGYTQQKINFSVGGSMALGIVIGLGAAILLSYLSNAKT